MVTASFKTSVGRLPIESLNGITSKVPLTKMLGQSEICSLMNDLRLLSNGGDFTKSLKQIAVEDGPAKKTLVVLGRPLHT